MLKELFISGIIIGSCISCQNSIYTSKYDSPESYYITKDAGILSEHDIAKLGNVNDPYINDAYLREKAINTFIPLLKEKQYLPKDQLAKQTQERRKSSLTLNQIPLNTQIPQDLYQTISDSTVMIFAFYPCPNPNCSWHINGVSTGFFISQDGLVATNYHVTQLKGNTETLGIMTRDGRCFTLKEVVATDPLHDIAILRFSIEDSSCSPLPLRPNAPIGTNLNIVSHPSGYFYIMTKGILSRRAKWIRRSNQVVTMPKDSKTPEQVAAKFIYCDTIMTDAEYAGGSSGGALCDDQGNVIGMVSSTRPIFAGATPQNPQGTSQQMVLRFCVPVEKIIQLFQEPTTIKEK